MSQGKGSTPRKGADFKAYTANWERTFGKKEPGPEKWGVWCAPIHPKLGRVQPHWWGQFWETKDHIPQGEPVTYAEADARREADKQTRIDVDRAYTYEARPIQGGK